MRHSYHHNLNRVRNQGVVMWNRARHAGSIIDRHIKWSATAYNQAIGPALRSAGFDTRAADSLLSQNYSAYNQYATALNDGANIVQGIARHLHGGTYKDAYK